MKDFWEAVANGIIKFNQYDSIEDYLEALSKELEDNGHVGWLVAETPENDKPLLEIDYGNGVTPWTKQ